VPGRDLPDAQLGALAAIGVDATVPPPDLEQDLNLARLHLHQALAHALHTLADAQRSIEGFEQQLTQHRARLRTLGYPAL